MGEGYAAIHRGGGLPVVGGGGGGQVMAGLPYIKIYFFKTLIALKVKCF